LEFIFDSKDNVYISFEVSLKILRRNVHKGSNGKDVKEVIECLSIVLDANVDMNLKEIIFHADVHNVERN